MEQKKIIVGAFEHITLPALGNVAYLAKIDTGAYRGAVHVDELIFNDDDSLDVVLDGQTYHFSATSVKKVKIISSNGHASFRPVVQMPITVQGISYQTWIGLTSRDQMKFPALIGRFFLRENQILVDVTRNSKYDVDGRRCQ